MVYRIAGLRCIGRRGRFTGARCGYCALGRKARARWGIVGDGVRDPQLPSASQRLARAPTATTAHARERLTTMSTETRTRILVVFTALLLGGCEDGEDDDHAVTRETCVEMCALLSCDAEVTPEQISACADRCISKQQDVDPRGSACTEAYERSVACFSDLECSEFQAWEAGDARVCEDALLAFEQSCPDLTFDFRE